MRTCWQSKERPGPTASASTHPDGTNLAIGPSPIGPRSSGIYAQVPALNIFESSLRRGKFDESRKLSNGSLMKFSHIYPMDAVYDKPEDVPQDVSPSPLYFGTTVCPYYVSATDDGSCKS